MNQIILLEKQTPASSSWKNLIRKKKLNQYSVEDIVKKYNGFEGDIVFSDLIGKNFIDVFEEYRSLFENYKSENYHLLCVCENDTTVILENFFEMIGYDFGICICEEDSIYSSIFNEILFGNVEQLISFKDCLNANLLFPNKELANKYLQLHHDLLLLNMDVEHDEDMQIYEIWKYK
jgi:hypothetical protein